MATLGGNSVHAATAAVIGGRRAALVARRGEDFPARRCTRAGRAGHRRDGLVDVAGPTVRNWVVYEPDGRRHWLYRTPPERSAEVAPRPDDLDPRPARAGQRWCTSRPCRWRAPRRWSRAGAAGRARGGHHPRHARDLGGRRRRPGPRAGRRVDVFVPSLEELVRAHRRRPARWPGSRPLARRRGSRGRWSRRARRRVRAGGRAWSGTSRRCRPGGRHHRRGGRVLRRARRRAGARVGTLAEAVGARRGCRPAPRSPPAGSLRLLEPGVGQGRGCAAAGALAAARRRRRSRRSRRPAAAAERPACR